MSQRRLLLQNDVQPSQELGMSKILFADFAVPATAGGIRAFWVVDIETAVHALSRLS